jgi:hypothetical protein
MLDGCQVSLVCVGSSSLVCVGRLRKSAEISEVVRWVIESVKILVVIKSQ